MHDIYWCRSCDTIVPTSGLTHWTQTEQHAVHRMDFDMSNRHSGWDLLPNDDTALFTYVPRGSTPDVLGADTVHILDIRVLCGGDLSAVALEPALKTALHAAVFRFYEELEGARA